MELKRPLNSLSDSDLLDILDKTSIEEKDRIKLEDASNDDVLNFMSFYKIEEGKHFVSSLLLTKLYLSWTKIDSSALIFQKAFGFYFTKYKQGLSIGYLINLDKFNVSKQLFNYLSKAKRTRRDRKRHIQKFLSYYHIKPGSFPIDLDSVFYLYDKWLYDNKLKSSMRKMHVGQLLKQFLDVGERNNPFDRTYFLVDHSILNHITLEEIERIKKGVADRRAKEKKRNKTS